MCMCRLFLFFTVNMLQPEDSSVLWLLVVGFIIAFVLAFGIGANDVANSFGTSVGSKVITLFQACIIASIFEMSGALLIGSKVSDTVRKGIIDINRFDGQEEFAMAGAFSALTATSIWLLIATFLNLPVSGTHSIVGATIGYGLVAFGADGITWSTLGKIAASWIISPILSGFVSSVVFIMIDRFILKSNDPLKRGLLSLPFLFGATMFINLFSIFYTSSDVFGMGNWSWYYIFALCVGVSALIALFIAFFVNPWLKIKIMNSEENQHISNDISAKFQNRTLYKSTQYDTESQTAEVELTKCNRSAINGALEVETVEVSVTFSEKECNEEFNTKQPNDIILGKDTEKLSPAPLRPRNTSTRSRTSSFYNDILKPSALTPDDEAHSSIKDDPYSARLFKYLQILTAAFGAFAHGGNDVSNAIGPCISLWLIYKNGYIVSKAATPIWILLYGGVGIVVGLCVWGRRVIATIGENLSPITPSSGFAIEIGSALTVLLASNLGIPVSTTHCKVGSVVVVGRVRSKEVVDWSLFGNIVLSWIVTMPITGGISAGVYAVIREVLY